MFGQLLTWSHCMKFLFSLNQCLNSWTEHSHSTMKRNLKITTIISKDILKHHPKRSCDKWNPVTRSEHAVSNTMSLVTKTHQLAKYQQTLKAQDLSRVARSATYFWQRQEAWRPADTAESPHDSAQTSVGSVTTWPTQHCSCSPQGWGHLCSPALATCPHQAAVNHHCWLTLSWHCVPSYTTMTPLQYPWHWHSTPNTNDHNKQTECDVHTQILCS